MKIWYSSYQLYPKSNFQAQSKMKFRTGALLRVRFEDQSVGYADVCPYPEMGDRPLELELKQISLAKPSRLGMQSLGFARLDASARAEGKSLYMHDVKIKNHFLISDLMQFDSARVESLAISGYSHFKVKLGRDLAPETLQLEALMREFDRVVATGSVEKLHLRLDFNAALSRDRLLAWLDKNQKRVQPYLEFIEDPCPYDFKEWSEIGERRGLTLALDLAADPVACHAAGADVIVVKPAIQDVKAILGKFKSTEKKLVFTHYLDFPLGQMCAFQTAQSVWKEVGSQMLVCGLQHHDIYEGFTFQDAIKSDGPYVLPPEGSGFGFDKLLERQTWTELV